jgi:hypothetical protein
MKVLINKKVMAMLAVAAAGIGLSVATEKGVYYCKYCGYQAASVRTLTANKCQRHPAGSFAGPHALYEGSAKEEYVCKFCGYKAKSIRTLTAQKCRRHPTGAFKGTHEPAL